MRRHDSLGRPIPSSSKILAPTRALEQTWCTRADAESLLQVVIACHLTVVLYILFSKHSCVLIQALCDGSAGHVFLAVRISCAECKMCVKHKRRAPQRTLIAPPMQLGEHARPLLGDTARLFCSVRGYCVHVCCSCPLGFCAVQSTRCDCWFRDCYVFYRPARDDYSADALSGKIPRNV
jgi:hypothetical protein